MSETLKLHTGALMPQFGLGTWQAKDPEELSTALRAALDSGYRLIDTAHMYGNENVIGKVLEEYFSSGKLKRSDVFITTKLPFYAMEPAAADALIPAQLAALGLDYVDLYLVHVPVALQPRDKEKPSLFDLEPVDIPHIDTWRVLEKWQKKGVLKSLGLSNFNERQILALFNEAEVKPANLQVECHIYWPQLELHTLAQRLGMTFTAYGPLGSPGRVNFKVPEGWPEANPMEEPLVQRLAEKYAKSPAQILLRQLLHRGIAVIPKSVREARVRENADIFDFSLTEQELAEFAGITKRVRLFELRFIKFGKQYPFDDVV